MIHLEVCSNSVHSALAAQAGGAVRVELCDNLPEGGTTPSLAQIQMARRLLHIQLYVIIRPRGGDFLYDEMEFEIMQSEIRMCGEAGCDGVVIGILKADGSIDTERSRQLVAEAHRYQMGVTFHRAFDRCRDLSQGLEDVISIGCERILTSGGKNSALEGSKVIRQLIEQAAGRISIQPGSGITENNIENLVHLTGLKEFHGSFRSSYPSRMQYFNNSIKDMESEHYVVLTDKGKVEKAIYMANRLA